MKTKKVANIMLVFSLLLIVAGVIMEFYQILNKRVFYNEKFYQYFAGRRYEYEGVLELNKNREIVNLNFDNEKYNVTLDSTPIYYDKDDRVIFPHNMMIAFPNNNMKQYKINYFSTIKLSGNKVLLKDRTMEKEIKNAFLYDGRNMYFFIDPMKIETLHETYMLPPLSYAIVDYQNQINIFNYEEQKMYNLSLDNTVIIAKGDGYLINMSIDSMKQNASQANRLLIKKIEMLPNLENN